MNDKKCPLCGKANGCMAGTGKEKDCWCHSLKVPQELVDKVPEDQKRKACICKSCVEAFYEAKK
jgi:hypothetical protein